MQGTQPPVVGAKRAKLAGYLSAANQVRQSYVNAYYGAPDPQNKGMNVVDAEAGGAWTDADLTSRDKEEMVLFPSYARRRMPESSNSDHRASMQSTRDSIDGRRPFTQHDGDHDEPNIIDVDVRGWIFQPNTGPLTRKNKILMGLARQMCGLPVQGRGVTKEDQEATKAAQFAMEGGSVNVVEPGAASVGELTGHELDTAHGYLKSRLAPFMHRPIPNLSVTVFFYNSKTSQSRIITTDDYGHFSMRAGLPFVPTHVRVLASEKLKATEAIQLIEAHGVSVVSDIDDTIKHSAISLGAREIFRNTFIRELNTLVVPGTPELYNTLALLDVPIHYVSNSPWQIYPLIAEFLKLANLPINASFHLKQYTGMFQGMFEPVAERKKPSLERILKDFPDRQFILIGDSGEADLEVYTEVALTNPGRIKAVFIRDVTTKEEKDNHGFFGSRAPSVREQTPSGLESHEPEAEPKPEDQESLIDFSSSDDEGPEVLKTMEGHTLYHSQNQDDFEERRPALPSRPASGKPPPPKPNKPAILRGRSIEKDGFPITSFSKSSPRMQELQESDPSTKPAPKPTPPQSRNSSPAASIRNFLKKSESSEDNGKRESSPGGSVWRRDSSPASSLRNLRLSRTPTDQTKRDSIDSISSLTSSGRISSFPPDRAVPSRHPNLRRAATAASNGYIAPPATEVYDPASGIEKKVWLWRQRWERSREVLEPRGIILESWRRGTDILEVAVALVEAAKEEEERRLRKLNGGR